MRKFAVRVLSSYLIFALLLVAADLAAPLRSAGTQIAFTGNFDGEPDIWLLDTARGLLLNLTRHDPGAQYSASWSPDGSQIVYETGTARFAVGGGAADTGLHILDLASGAITRLPPTSDLIRRESPSWSPDGTRIVYEDGIYIRVYDLLMAQETVVGRGASPTWTRDSQRIIHLAYDVEQDLLLTSVILSALDGSRLGQIDTHILSPQSYWDRAVVSPNGQLVSLGQDFISRGDDIYTFDIACFDVCSRLPQLITVGDDPNWSPDGELIVYTCFLYDTTYGNLCAIPPDGAGRQILTTLRRPFQAQGAAVRPLAP